MRWLAKLFGVALLLATLAAWADESDDADDAIEAAEQQEAEKADEAPAANGPSRQVVYVPPSRGAARVRTGGGTRGTMNAPTLAALAPDHVGVTWRAQPAFAWFLSEKSDARVDFTLVDPEAVDPLLEVTLPGPFEAGVQLVRLADYGVELEPGHSYDWSVALVLDPENRDLDVVAAGAIRREAPEPGVEEAIGSGTPAHVALARAGVWYDALESLSTAIARSPGDEALLAERAALLEQVDVGAAAAWDRARASAP